MPDSGVAEGVQGQVASLGAADIVVGLSTYNNAGTIAHAAEAIQNGLRTHFAAMRCVIVNADLGSTDSTPEMLLEACRGEGLLQLPAPAPRRGIAGKAGALRATFDAARSLEAKGCVVFEPDVSNIAPGWVEGLLRPVLDQQYDFVAPDYARHKFDGAINKSIVYPLTRALYGKRIYQPIGGDYSFSPQLIAHYLAQDVWAASIVPFGIETWLSAQAVRGRFKICQAKLGPKVREPVDPGLDLSEMLAHVLGPLFQEMERDPAFWQRVRGSEAVPVFGAAEPPAGEGSAGDVQKMIDSFRLGYQNLTEIWGLVLPPATLMELKRVARADAGQFRLPDETWVRSVYDYSLAYHLRVINRDHLLRAMTPLYLGWVASFVLEMKEASAAEVERRVERLCLVYESSKPYLISRWRWPERFNP